MSVSRLSQTSLQNAFQKYNNVWDGKSAVGSMEPIGVVNLSSAASTVTFSSIPQTYSHLQVRLYAQTSRGTYNLDDLITRVGSGTVDTGNNYSWHSFYAGFSSGTTSTAYSGNAASQGYIQCSGILGTGVGPTFGVGVIDFLDYTSANKNKTIKYMLGNDTAGSASSFLGSVGLFSACWYNSSTAINTITFSAASGANFNAYTSFALYGLK
jgi:hypothetical protein